MNADQLKETIESCTNNRQWKSIMKEESHWEDIPEVDAYISEQKPWQIKERCTHKEHNPPGYIYIPQGKRFIHVCPGCGRRTVMENPITYHLDINPHPEIYYG